MIALNQEHWHCKAYNLEYKIHKTNTAHELVRIRIVLVSR